MNRRRFLAALAAGSALAGCISDSSSSAGETNERDPTTTTATTELTDTTRRETTDVPTTTIARTPTTAPEPATAEPTTPEPATTEPATAEPTTTGATDAPTTTGTSGAPTDTPPSEPATTTATPEPVALQAAPGDCPTYGENVVRVVCHDVAPSDAPMVMEPSRETLDLPGEIEFTLKNGTGSRFDTNFYSARLDKLVDGEWYLIAPQGWPEPLTPLPAGASHTWIFSMMNEVEQLSPSDSTPAASSEETSRRTVGGLGGGRYAFGIDGWFKGGSYQRKTAFAATVELRGDPVELTTSDDIEDVTVEGDVLTARLTGGYTEREGAREAVYVLERVDETPDTRVITEQLLRPGGIGPPNLPRDALALVTDNDVREVRLTGQTTSSPPFGARSRVIEYEGTTYEINPVEIETEVRT